MVRKRMDDTTDTQMKRGRWRGKKFSWVVKNQPDYILWIRARIPECAPELFKLVQFADLLQIDRTKPTFHLLTQIHAFETKWDRLRKAHTAWLNVGIPITNLQIGEPTKYTYSINQNGLISYFLPCTLCKVLAIRGYPFLCNSRAPPR